MTRPARQIDALALDGDLRQTLVTARSLGRAGLGVGIVEVHPHAPAFRSRWCAARGVVADRSRTPDAFVDDVLAFAGRHAARVIITSHDGSIEALRRRRAEVERQARLALGSERALALAVDKTRTLALAESLGIGVPRSFELSDAAAVTDAVAETGLPVVVKPAASWVWSQSGGNRLVSVCVTTRREAVDAVAEISAEGGSSLLQEWLPGRREAVSLLRADGRIWARFAQVAHRMQPPLGGSSVLRESIRVPRDIGAWAEELVHAMDLDGYAEVEFRRDASGRARLMEVNPRLSASIEVAVRAGVDFPRLLYDWAAGEPLTSHDGYRIGCRVRWLGGELRWLRETLRTQGRPDVTSRSRAIAALVHDSLRRTAYDYFDPGDLRPALAATGGFVSRRLPHALHGRNAEVSVP
jgi:predicted ATP-grasp superfamily ATP-dependent carboligase